MIKTAAKQALLLASLALLPAIVQGVYLRQHLSWRESSTKDEVSVAQARQWGEQTMWIDARPAEEFEAAHVPGAMRLTAEEWDQLLRQVLMKWSPERKLVVYCSKQTCGASREVARRLKDEAGLKNVFVLSGGWEGWEQTAR